MNMTTGRKPRLVDDDDYDLESSRSDGILSEDLDRPLDDDSPTDELVVVPDESDQ